MFRFSCFQAHTHSNKHKKTIQPSAEAMKKTLEDASGGRVPMGFSSSAAKDEPCLKEAGDTFIGKADHVADCSHTEGDSKSREMESECNSFRDIADSQKELIKKSQSLGSGLNWKGRTPGAYGSEDETEHGFYYDGSADHSGLVVADRLDHHGINPPDQFQGPMPSDSIRVNSDFAKNNSIFSIGDLEHSEIEITDKGYIHLSGSGDSGDQTPHTPPVIVKSSSLPCMGSPNRLCRSPLPRSRSAEDLNALDSRKNGMGREVGRRVQTQAREDPFLDYEKNHDEIPVGDSYESYNYVESAKDWIIPVPDGVNMGSSANKETSYHHGDEFSPQNFRLKRIEEWVIDLQHRGPFEQFDQFAPSDDHDLLKGNGFLEEPTVTKLEVKVNPGMDAAKRYISSLNASATAAQLTNLGLVMIPFFSAFGSLKALNLSGNSIVRITAGALPRGLHILNLSKNNISSIEGLRDLTRIRVLDLSYNRILRIGHGLAGCSSIKELYLAGNKISEVEGFHRLLKLNVLDLRYNKISTAKCLGQLAANYNSLQALSLEGNPAQKNVGDEQLKKYVQSLLPHLTYYNRQSIKVGTMKDTSSDRSARGLRVEAKTMRKGTHGIVAQKVSSSSSHGRKTQVVASQRISSRSRHGRPLPPSGNRTNQVNKLLSLRNDSSLRRSRSEGTLGANRVL